MTVFWMTMALMVLAVLASIIWPLIRRREKLALRSDYDLKVYRDQLKEVERDEKRNLLSADQAEAARTEIERRMLAVGEERKAEEKRTDEGGARPSHGVAMIISGLLIAAAIGYYFETGSPHYPDQPLASRNLPNQGEETANAHGPAGSAAEQIAQNEQMQAAVGKLAEKLLNEPNNIDGWMMLARSYLAMDRIDDAVNAFKRAIEITDGKDAYIAADYGEVLMAQADSTFTDESLLWFKRALGLDPLNSKSRFYLAAHDARKGDLLSALQGWADLKVLSPPDAPWLDAIDFQMSRAATEQGVSLDTIKPSAEALALAEANPDRLKPMRSPALAAAEEAPGPTAEDMKAAAEMSEGDRSAMIRTMVERLAGKLQENPDDLAGWQRLARAYGVLGETEKAKEAEAQIARLQQSGGGSAAPAASAPEASTPAMAAPGPTQQDMKDAAQMSDGDRSAMIRSMVERLAGKLQENPDDLAGWQRLARAYEVLGETEKAAAAQSQIRRLRGQ